MKGCEKRIRAILSKIGNIPTIWIGPPNWCEDKGYNKLLREIMGPRGYYPSYKLTFERQKDGRHPTMASSAMWMDKIVEWMNSGHCVHPFRLEMPDKHDRRYRQITILPPGTRHRADSTAMKKDSLSMPVEGTVPETTESPAATKEPATAGKTSPAAADKTVPAVKHVNHKDSV